MEVLDKEKLRNSFFYNIRTYRGGEFRNESQSNRTDLALVYQTQGWDGSDLAALQVAGAILGTHAGEEQTRNWNNIGSRIHSNSIFTSL